MGGACCKGAGEFNPDGSPKEPQTKEQKKEDPKDLRLSSRAADWQQMRMLLRRMPMGQICSGAAKDEGPDDEHGNTALHFAVFINHLRGVKKLMRYGIPPAMRNKAGKTPLHMALETGKLKAARLLLEKSLAVRAAAKKPSPFLINISDEKGVTPLLAVAAAGRLRLTREILALCKELDMGVDLDQKDREGNSLLSYAAKWGWFDELGAWMDKCAKPKNLLNLQNKQGETVLGHVLLFAASGLLAKPRAASLLSRAFELGATAKLPAFQERVPLINLAAAADDTVCYQMLIAQGANPSKAKDALGRTPLHYAAAKGSRTVGADLLDKGLKPYALDGQRNTPLHLAAMRGQEALVSLLLDRADDKDKALLTPNKAGLTAYHLALKAGPEDKAQRNSLTLIEVLGSKFSTPVIGRKKAVVDTPLLLAIQGHQDQVVKKLLEKGLSPNEGNVRGELPLARVLSCATANTYDNDTSVFDQLISAGADMNSAGETAHPLLAICKNNLSKFAEKAVGVLTERCGALDWGNKRDDKGYTPLALAAYYDNAWLIKYLIDEVRVDPNADDQRSRSTEPEVVGTTGSLCCTKPLTVAGTVEGQTPLMCAAKGASVAAVQLLLNRGADVRAADSQGRTALQHAMQLDKAASLKVAAALLQMGAQPQNGVQVTGAGGQAVWRECRDLVDETWPHRAVRYGCDEFLGLWAGCGGSLELLATTADDADDLPGAELRVEEKGDFLDFAPSRVSNALEEEDEELQDNYNGEDSEKAQDEEDNEGGAPAADGVATKAAGAVAEGTEAGEGAPADGDSSDDDCGEDVDLAQLIATGEVETHYAGPTPRMLLRWRRRGSKWWDEFWVDSDALPDVELEGDPCWEDTYNACEEGDEWVDEEDVEDEIWESINAEQRRAAIAVRVQAAEQEKQRALHAQQPSAGSAPPSPSMIERMSAGLAHKMFRRRLPNAVAPDVADADDGTFAAGSPSKWLRRKSASSSSSLPGSPLTGGMQLGAGTSPVKAQQLGGSSASSSARKQGPGPVAEGREEVEDFDGEGDDVPLLSRQDKRAASSGVEARMQAASQSVANAMSAGARGARQSLRAAGGKLTSGTAGELLYANEPYYQPDSKYVGLPRYMRVETHQLSDQVYAKHRADFAARLASYDIKSDKPMEGPELRARNIAWYHKSMGPTEYPLKIGKWKSFLRLSKKATEGARQRRPCKPGEKPKPRKKTAWFGLPDLPSRAELALTSPLVYAVRLGRVRCVAALLRYSAALVNMPDAHGSTPLAYAMFLLAKDRHNKPMQQIVDLLLAARPLVDTASVWRLRILPQMRKELADLEAATVATGGESKLPRRERKALVEKRDMVAFLEKNYSARLFPSIMEPLVLAALLNDVGRMAVMVTQCGANINNAWVWLPDIPTYFQGMWEKQLSRCHSRVTPLHVAICTKKFDSVRALLDLGSDPNLSGGEYTGNFKKDLQRQAKLYQQKAKEGAELKANGVKSNPYAKLWQDSSFSLRMMLMGAKRFISSIEIPGLSRPHPWLSPLHLSCRLGLPEVTFLLIKRGGAVNGGPASAYAPKSPLEEALSYARANAQAYGTMSERFNYYYILESTCLEESATNQGIILAALAKQRNTRKELEAKVKAKAEALAANAPKDKDGKGKKPEYFLVEALPIISVGAGLAYYDPKNLLHIPMPGMNLLAAAGKGMKMMKNAMAMLDPVKGAIKAVALAAKIIIKVLLEMMKRPIAHYDPALYCAHVMLYHRAPINPSEKQTGILMRDILDNGNGLEGADRRLSYYRWLGIEPEQVNDHAWVNTVINRVSVLKANVKYGFMNMDLTGSFENYERNKKKFMSAVQSAVLNTGTASVLPQYLKYVVQDGVGSQVALDKAKAAATLRAWLSGYVDTLASKQDAKYQEYLVKPVAEQEDYVNRACFGVLPTPADRNSLALELLPQWVRTAPPPNPAAAQGGVSQAVAEATMVDPSTMKTPTTEPEVYDFLITKFLAYDPATSQSIIFKDPPTGPDVWTQMLQGTAPGYLDAKEISYTMPDVTQADIDAMQPTIVDITDADVCSAVVRAYNAVLTQQAEAASKQLQARSAALADAAAKDLVRHLQERAAEKAGVMQQMALDQQEPRGFDEEPIFVAAMETPMWEAAASKLGGTPAAKALMSQLRSAQASGTIPRIPDPLEFAKSLGQGAMVQGKEALFSRMEEQLGQRFSTELRNELGRSIPAVAPGQGGGRTVDGAIDDAAAALTDLADTAGKLADAQTYLDMADRAIGPDGRAMLQSLQAAIASGEPLPIPDPEDFARQLVDSAIGAGPEALLALVERKTGIVLPDSVRKDVKDGMRQWCETIKEKYEEGGISAAMGACTFIAAGCAVAVSTGASGWAEGQVEEGMAAMEGMVNDAGQVLEGNFESLDGMAAELLMKLPFTRKLRDAAAPLTGALKEANDLLKEMADVGKQLKAQVKALTGEACGELDELSSELSGIGEQVFEGLGGELAEATDQFMAGLELMLEVDAQALMEALEEAREVLMMILELVGIDEMV